MQQYREMAIPPEIPSGTAQRMSRIFLVGCPRSGTTLLQSLLAGHSRILSFPESHFFTQGFGGSRFDRLKKRLAGGRHLQRIFERWLNLLETKGLQADSPIRPAWRRQLIIDQFVAQLDRWTRNAGKDVWIEKTPMHLDHIHQITPAVPDARFLHIVRDGRAVVESLYRVTREHPDIWGGPRPVEACIAQWNRCLNLTLRHRNDPGHHIVCYESLVREPQATLKRICAFLGLDWEPAMLEKRKSSAEAVSFADEDWKAGNRQESIASGGLSNFRQTFDTEEQQMISQSLNLEGYFELCPAMEPKT